MFKPPIENVIENFAKIVILHPENRRDRNPKIRTRLLIKLAVG